MMATILLAETDPKLKRIVHDVENMCHEAGLGVIIHHEGEDLDDLLDMAECTLLVFTPNGKLTLEQAAQKYGGNVLLAVGGFEEERDFKSSIYSRAEDTVSLGKEFLTIPEVIEKIIDAYETAPEGGVE
jgi:rRNA pseudouridine-1189 N-methylase Emg1 (Nep1/Mra1 family)